MLSRSDYFDFQVAVEEILAECFCGVDIDQIPDEASLATHGYCNATKDKVYHFTDDSTHLKDKVIRVCQGLPIYPPLNENFCGTIAYKDLYPDDFSTIEEVADASELADKFFALLELNDMGIAHEVVKNKYGFQLFLIDPRLRDVIKQNRSSFGQKNT